MTKEKQTYSSDKSANNERELLMKVAEGDERAFEVIFRQHWNKLYSVAFIISKSSEFAEDVAQEVLMQVWKNRKKLCEVDNFSGYVNVSARHLAYRKLSRISIEQGYRTYLNSKIDHNENTIDKALDFNELNQIIREGIEKLPPQQKKVFLLSRIKGLSHEEIAVKMQLSRNSVKDYIVKAIAFLRKYLRQHAAAPIRLLFF